MTTKTGRQEQTATSVDNYLKKYLEDKMAEKSRLAKEQEQLQEEINALMEESKVRFNAEFEDAKKRLENQYGEITRDEYFEIRQAERHNQKCAGCKGLPCANNGFVQKISRTKFGKLNVCYCTCEYKKAWQQEYEIEKKFGISKIPQEYYRKTWDDYIVDIDNYDAVEFAKKLADHPDKGAYFYGGVGTGKTFLASLVAQEVLKLGREVIFCTVPVLSTKLRSTFKENSTINENELLEKLYTADTLILDDIGMEKPTRFVCSTLCSIFNERYNAKLQTILTSNYSLKTLEKIFNNPTDAKEETIDGSRIYDRCKQMCIPVKLGGKSRR